jgi:Raf kinase inhibitor-like YbhB/YbcL family protein
MKQEYTIVSFHIVKSLNPSAMKKLSLLILLMSATLLHAQTFTLESKDLGGQFEKVQEYNSFGCSGENISPQLTWKNAPAGTKSFAVTIYDPDAPTGSGWWHWLIIDIPAGVHELVKGAGDTDKKLAPEGSIQLINNFGIRGFGGPCPPVGDGPHRYIITVYALKVDKLGLDKTASPPVTGYTINQNAIGRASLMVYYKR